MRSEMIEMQIDLDKMPLGALSRKQIESAYVPPRLFVTPYCDPLRLFTQFTTSLRPPLDPLPTQLRPPM